MVKLTKSDKVPRWNEISGLTLEENMMLDSLAHGTYKAEEMLPWICKMAEWWGKRGDRTL